MLKQQQMKNITRIDSKLRIGGGGGRRKKENLA